jgi:hypothetical protein
MMLRIMTVSILCLSTLTGTLKAEGPVNQSIDEETIAAYEKLGAIYGGFKYNYTNKWGNPRFWEGEEAASKGLPGFNIVWLSFAQ